MASNGRFVVDEHPPLYAGSNGHRYVVVDTETGVQIRTFRRRKDANVFRS